MDTIYLVLSSHKTYLVECDRRQAQLSGCRLPELPCARFGNILQDTTGPTDVASLASRPKKNEGRPTNGAAVDSKTGVKTGQEPRSTRRSAALTMTVMDLSIHATPLPHTDPEASLAFYRGVLGFEVRKDVGAGEMRWITVGPPGQPDMSIVLTPPAIGPGITDDERRTIAEMMAKGTFGWIMLATKDLDGTFERVQASGAEVVQEPVEQYWGDRDCAFRDPAGTLVRIQELR